MEQTEVTNVTTSTVSPPVVTEPPQKVYQTKKVIFRAYQIIWYILGVVEVLIAFRVILKMLGANAFSGFTSFIYAISDPLTLPFNGIFGTTVAQTSVFEWSSIIAAIVYAIVACGLVQLIQLIKPTNPQEVAQTVDSQ